LGVSQNESVHPQLESQPGPDENPKSQQTLGHDGKTLGIVAGHDRAGPLAIREAARCVDRDVKGVHALLNAGILQKTEHGLIVFPFDAICVDIMLHAA
jgi:hypothetical protein